MYAIRSYYEKESAPAEIVAEAKATGQEWTAKVAGKYGPHYPAQGFATQSALQGIGKSLDEALNVERDCFVAAFKTDQARALVGNFLSDQYLMKCAKDRARTLGSAASSVAVLGAGIMGGGIAYQSAFTGTPAIMKDT